ncbi:MAG: DUF2079 domain-containing protein [Chloroflexota bacterium]|nr:DUF2079 domain-containing protein [Chloroflexota bacterium]
MKRRFEVDPAVARAVVWLLILTYSALFIWLSVTRHQSHHSQAYDLGNVNQAFWNTVRGRPLFFTNWRGVELSLATDSRLAMHVEPIYFLIAPIYALWQKPETLLVLQTVILALGAWPVYWLARDHLESRVAGIAFAAVYLLFPGLQAANLWEFHAVALAAPLLLFAFYYGQAGRWWLLWVFAILAMATKEEIPLTVFVIGLFFIIQGMRQSSLSGSSAQIDSESSQRSFLAMLAARHGLALSMVAIIWFFAAVFVIIPSFEGGGSPYLSYFQHLISDTPSEAAGSGSIEGLLAKAFSARNIDYLIDLYTPVAFLSFLNPLTMAFSFPDLAINLLSDHEPMHFVQKYHYTAPLVPGVMISAILGTAWLAGMAAKRSRLSKRSVALLLVFVVLVSTAYYQYYHGYTPLARAFEPYQVTEHDRLGNRIANEIPVDVAVSAERYLNPQVSGRETLFRYPYIDGADVIFVDLADFENVGGGLYGITRKILNGDEFGLVHAEDGYLLLERGKSSDLNLTDDFFGFARIPLDDRGNPQVQPEYPVDIVFGDVLRLIGFDVSAARRTEMPQTPLQFDLYWQTLEPLEENYQIALYLLDANGEVVGGPDYRWEPGLQFWYPTSRWPVTDTVTVPMRNMPWWTAQYDEYSVAVAVLTDKEAWDVSARLKAEILDEPTARYRLADEDTLVELMSFRTDVGEMPVPIEPASEFELPRGIYSTERDWINGIQLLGYDISPRRIRSGEGLEVTLYWRTQQEIDTDYTVFVHVVDDQGRLVGQHDAPPDMAGYPTSRWRVADIVPDRHRLSIPPDAPSGDYTIHLGLYRPSTGERLLLDDGSDALLLPVLGLDGLF